MTTKFRSISIAMSALVLTAGLQMPVSAMAAETAIAPEISPAGDIPDSQVFVDYVGPGFAIKVPEGWSRNDDPTGAVFSDKYNFVKVTSAEASVAPTVDSVTAADVAEIIAKGRAATVTDVSETKLDGGPAIRIQYQSNSAPNDVTGKQIRLDQVRYVYFADGIQVTLDMAAPAGADNVDQWLVMANSVKLH